MTNLIRTAYPCKMDYEHVLKVRKQLEKENTTSEEKIKEIFDEIGVNIDLNKFWTFISLKHQPSIIADKSQFKPNHITNFNNMFSKATNVYNHLQHNPKNQIDCTILQRTHIII